MTHPLCSAASAKKGGSSIPRLSLTLPLHLKNSLPPSLSLRSKGRGIRDSPVHTGAGWPIDPKSLKIDYRACCCSVPACTGFISWDSITGWGVWTFKGIPREKSWNALMDCPVFCNALRNKILDNRSELVELNFAALTASHPKPLLQFRLTNSPVNHIPPIHKTVPKKKSI